MPAANPDREGICERVLEGIEQGVTLAELCRTEGISRSTFHRWLDDDEELSGRFARARELGFDSIAEEALEIAEDGTNDWIERKRENGEPYEALNSEHVQRSKLRIETRLKLLAKWDPKRYGERIQTAQTDVAGNDVAPADPAAAIASILSAARQRRDADGSDLA